jgi:cytochrome c oxidase subunit 3
MPWRAGPNQREQRDSATRLGVALFLASLSVLFASALVLVTLTHAHAQLWRTAEMPALPRGLLVSSAAIAILSGALSRAEAHLRKNQLVSFERALWVALLAVAAFLFAQSLNWAEMAQGYRVGRLTLYPFAFHLLTGLHALHVLGGLVPLGKVIAGAGRREYSSAHHQAVKLTAWYWHFLAATWFVLLGALWAMS